jgi:hypothetical protein
MHKKSVNIVGSACTLVLHLCKTLHVRSFKGNGPGSTGQDGRQIVTRRTKQATGHHTAQTGCCGVGPFEFFVF